MAATVFPMTQNRQTHESSNDTPTTIQVQPPFHNSNIARTRPVSTPVPLPFHEYMNEIERASYMGPYQHNAFYAPPYATSRHISQDHHHRQQSYYQYRKQNMFGPYLMLQTLGEGEFGKVKLGIHIETEQEVNVSDSFNPQSSRQL